MAWFCGATVETPDGLVDGYSRDESLFGPAIGYTDGVTFLQNGKVANDRGGVADAPDQIEIEDWDTERDLVFKKSALGWLLVSSIKWADKWAAADA